MTFVEKIEHLLAQNLIVKEQVSEQVAAERMRVCEGCDRRDKKANKCLECGCFLDLKTSAATNWNAKKLRNEITHCPLGKWGDLETANEYRRRDGKEQIKK